MICQTFLADSLSVDIKLETEGENGVVEDEPAGLPSHVYHPRRALRQALSEWLPEFKRYIEVKDRVLSKPQVVVPILLPPKPANPEETTPTTVNPHLPPAPGLPSVPVPHINTCVPLTATTVTSSISTKLNNIPVVQEDATVTAQIPNVCNVNQLQALATASTVPIPAVNLPVDPNVPLVQTADSIEEQLKNPSVSINYIFVLVF